MSDEAKLYQVELEQTVRAVVYVIGTDRETVEEDATELVRASDWTADFEPDVTLTEVTTSKGQRVWSGGGKGNWVAPR